MSRIVHRLFIAGAVALLIAFLSPWGTAAADVARKPDSTADVKPPTHPRPDVRPAPHPDNGRRGIVAITENGDGTTSATRYSPAPGVSEGELFERLKARGVRGLQEPTAMTAAQDDGPCAWWTATTLTCPRAEWARNGHGHPQIYFADHTGAGWPVDASVAKWNEAQGVDSWYRWATCPAVAGSHCVHVFSSNYGATGWTGQVTYQWNSSTTHFIDGTVEVRLNDHYAGNAQENRSNSCHELGHALGLGHNGSTTSCMYTAAIPNPPQFPDGNDFALLADLYA